MFKEPKDSIKMYPREYKYLALEDCDTKFLVGIIRRYRRDAIKNGILCLLCLMLSYGAVFFSVNSDTRLELVAGILLAVVFAAFGFFAAATPTANLARDYLDARWMAKRKVEIIDEDELK